jgi:hypothetical protein
MPPKMRYLKRCIISAKATRGWRCAVRRQVNYRTAQRHGKLTIELHNVIHVPYYLRSFDASQNEIPKVACCLCSNVCGEVGTTPSYTLILQAADMHRNNSL